jgi:hypothetical protein
VPAHVTKLRGGIRRPGFLSMTIWESSTWARAAVSSFGVLHRNTVHKHSTRMQFVLTPNKTLKRQRPRHLRAILSSY